jgi:hypothetical protein
MGHPQYEWEEVDGASVANFKLLSRHYRRRTEEDHEEFLGQSVCTPKVDPENSRIASGSTNLSKSLFHLWGGVRQRTLGTCHCWIPCTNTRITDGYGVVSEMGNARGNRNAQRKPNPVPLRPPQIPSELYRPSNRRLSAKLVPTFADRGYRVVSATDTHGRILGFLDRSDNYFFQVAPQLYSRGWVDPIPDPLLLRKIL